MNKLLRHQNMPELTLILGSVGMLLRLWLMTTANSQGFIRQDHISEILLLALTGGFLVACFLLTRALRQGNKYIFNFPVSAIAGAGSALAAFGIGIASVSDLFAQGDTLSLLTGILGLLAALAMFLAAKCRWEGKRPAILLHGILCLWLILRLLNLYRTWSSDPQLEDYCFQLMAVVFSMLAAYHRAAFNGKEGNRAQYSFFALSGLYFCCVSLAGPDNLLIYLALGIWLYTDMCNLAPMPRQERGDAL